MSKKCVLCNLLKTVDPLYKTKSWCVFLDQNQDYLGRCVIILKRHSGNLDKLSPKEWSEFQKLVPKHQYAIQKTFPQIDLFNWTCLMNHAFAEKPFNPHIHWHVRPRHEKPIRFMEKAWKDAAFGKHYVSSKQQKMSEKLRKELIGRIRQNA